MPRGFSGSVRCWIQVYTLVRSPEEVDGLTDFKRLAEAAGERAAPARRASCHVAGICANCSSMAGGRCPAAGRLLGRALALFLESNTGHL